MPPQPTETTVRCSDCNRPLCSVSVYDPSFPRTVSLQAECAYGCTRADGTPERSYAEVVSGRFRVGGHGENDPSDASSARMVTAVTDVRHEGHTTIFKPEKIRRG